MKPKKCGLVNGKWTHGSDPCKCVGGMQIEHHCNVVPAEMHTQMMNERDERIRELSGKLAEASFKPIIHQPVTIDEPQPAREGWNWANVIAGSIASFVVTVIVWTWLSHPVAPKGTGDSVDWQAFSVSLSNERDHWLRNSQAAWQALDCSGHLYPREKNIWKDRACEALNQ